MTVRIEDLPAKMRRQIRANLSDPPGANQGPARVGSRTGAPGGKDTSRYLCAQCAHPSHGWTAAEKHADQHQHPHIRLVLE